MVKLLEGQAREDLDAIVELKIRSTECISLFVFRSLDCGGVIDAPLSGHRLARPYRTHLARCPIADREDEIQRWCAGLSELAPVLAAQSFRRKM